MKNLIDRLNDFIENRKKEISEEKKKREISTLLRDAYSITLEENLDIITNSMYVNHEFENSRFSTIDFINEDTKLQTRVYFRIGTWSRTIFLFHKPDWEVWIRLSVSDYTHEFEFKELTLEEKTDEETGESVSTMSNSKDVYVPKEIVDEIENELKDIVYEALPDFFKEMRSKEKLHLTKETIKKFGLDKKEKEDDRSINDGSNDTDSTDKDAAEASD